MYKKIKGKKYRLLIDNVPYIVIYVRGEKFLSNKKTMPVFKVGKKFIRGYECFWLPLNIALKIESIEFRKTNKAAKNGN